ncbi:uncharacterized protein LOC133850209 isoform X1 [Drosophila sulfurigaster albostrigata]|uniref:uncharacterized protein LOC133850209 isoform X1 n=1 Tax=Drosophila sulfurigaster albostrigata TaxID=89887 RepID=UPI002D219D5B|nr:uncharacterized protein LOC133850209 isoform X1 [Drosophila sulfurigaster albostrigata]
MSDVRPLQYDIKWDVWEDMPITDIHFKNYSLVIEFMWTKSFLQNIVYKGVGLHEEEGMKEIFSNYCMHILRNECSVMMLSKDETQIVAVALLEWMTDEWHSWIVLPSTVPKGLFQEFIHLKKDLMQHTKIAMELDNFDSLTVHEVAFPDALYTDIDFQICMFDVFGSVAQHMHMPRVCFIALTTREQNAADLAEYAEYGRSIYSIYKVGNKRPFDVLRDLDEMYALLFLLPLDPILYYQDMPGFEGFHEALRAKERKEREEELMRMNEM